MAVAFTSPGDRGFSLLELLVVVAIISILAGLSLPSYLNYRTKASVVSYAMPILRACMQDIASYCMGNMPSSETESYDPINDSRFPNCKDTTLTAVGNVKIEVRVQPVCANDGYLSAGHLEAYLQAHADSYRVHCMLQEKTYKCYVE